MGEFLVDDRVEVGSLFFRRGAGVCEGMAGGACALPWGGGSTLIRSRRLASDYQDLLNLPIT